MTLSLDDLRGEGLLTALDVHFAKRMSRLSGDDRTEIVLASALVSRFLGQGHLCLPLGVLADVAVIGSEVARALAGWPDLASWRQLLESSPLVGGPEDSVATPLVLTGDGKLYLRRYFQHERSIHRAIAARIHGVDEDVDLELLREGLDRMFVPSKGKDVDWQRVAAVMAVRRRFAVISGGPGTGKTSTVVKIIALLVEQAAHRNQRVPRMLLVAPTGKAAARLSESIAGARDAIDCDERAREVLQLQASTIHRALGSLGGSSTRFTYGPENPLPVDIVLVDEASMVHAGLMARLLSAIPDRARVILLGDRNQLASVEAGAVLGDICAQEGSMFSRGFSRELQQLVDTRAFEPELLSPADTGIWDCVTQLRRSYRYKKGSGIQALAEAINQGDGRGALALFDKKRYDDIALHPLPAPGQLGSALAKASIEGFTHYLGERDVVARARAFERFRVLCAHRTGAHGVTVYNRLIAQELARAGHLFGVDEHYPGRPVLILVNDYENRLFNGDVGIVGERDEPSAGGTGTSRSAEEPPGRVVHFVGSDGSVRTLSSMRLPRHESVYAMSIHKSQGSEFDHVAVVLPETITPVLTRELVYTAVTRARRRVSLFVAPEVLVQAIAHRTTRYSGLRDLLWKTV